MRIWCCSLIYSAQRWCEDRKITRDTMSVMKMVWGDRQNDRKTRITSVHVNVCVCVYFLWPTLTIYLRACVLALCIYILEFDATSISSFSCARIRYTRKFTWLWTSTSSRTFIHRKARTHERIRTHASNKILFDWMAQSICSFEKVSRARVICLSPLSPHRTKQSEKKAPANETTIFGITPIKFRDGENCTHENEMNFDI